MNSISTIALSGMNAAARRLAVSASNIANATSTGALADADGAVPTGEPRAYAPLELVQTTSTGGGTQTSVTAVTPATITVSDPQAPFANQNGFGAAPDLDLTLALVSQVIAIDSYAANATVMKVNDRMSKMLFNITA